MITIEKLNQYEEFGGDYDMYYLLKQKNGEGFVSDDEWHLIRDLIQEYGFIKRGIADDAYADNINSKISESCDSQSTFEKIKQMA